MWKGTPPDTCEVHENELSGELFKPALDKGAQMVRYHDTPKSVHDIIRRIMREQRSVVLQIQRELVDERKNMINTMAGQTVNRELDEQAKQHQAELERVHEEERVQVLKKKDDSEEMRRRLEEEIRKVKEETRKIEEETREAAEETRKAEEEIRKVAEETREAKEGTRKAEEEIRKLEEEIGQLEEETRKLEEETREAKEETRRVEEETRKVKEQIRKRQEQAEKIKENGKEADADAYQSTDKVSGVRNTLLAPWVVSIFQFLRNSGPEIQSRIDEMDKVSYSASHLPHVPRPIFAAASGGSHYIGSRTAEAAQQALQNVQPTSRDPEVHADPGLFRRLRGSRVRGFRQRVTEHIRRTLGSGQGCACICHQRSGRYPQRESSIRKVAPVLMDQFQRFCREGIAWRHLRHPNILPLLGVTVSEHRFALVSEWMENGNVNEFIERDRHVNRAELVRRHSTDRNLTNALSSWLALHMA